MTNEERQLLLKDLCGRLPYHIMVEYRGTNVDLTQYARSVKIENCKPYLRPMSSMTEEEKKERDFYCGYKPYYEEEDCGERYITEYDMPDYIDFLYEHHLDFRGLIEKGLAIEAPEDMYKEIKL